MDNQQMIQARLLEAREHTKPWHDNIRRWRKLYDLVHYDQRKPNEPQFADPTYTNTVDLAVGMLMANEMTWHAYGWTPSADEEKKSSRIEKLLAGAVQINSEREEYYIPYEVLLNFVRDGGGVLYCVWDEEIASRAETQVELPDPESPDGVRSLEAFAELPLRLQVIDPLKISLVPGGPNRWLAVMRTEKISVYDAEQLFDKAISRYVDKDDFEKTTITGELVDYWDIVVETENGKPKNKVRNAILFEGETMKELTVMPGYTDLPYTVDFFKPTGRDGAGEWGQSIIQPLQGPVQYLEMAINRRQYQIDVYSAMPLVVKAEQGRAVDVDPAIANVIHLSPTDDMGFPEWRGNPPDVAQQIEFLRSRVQQSGFSDVMFGSGASQVSGYALSQLGDQNRIRLEQPIKHLEMLWTRWAKKALRLVDHFAKDKIIRVYGRMRGMNFAEQVLGEEAAAFMVSCEIKPEFPNEKVRKHAMASQVRGILSERTIMENYLDIEQPDDERRKRLIETIQTHPVVVQYTVLAELKRMAEEDHDAIAQLVFEQLQSGNVPGTPGRPTEAPNPAQLTGTQSASGQAQPQTPFGQDLGGQIEDAGMAAPNMQGEVS